MLPALSEKQVKLYFVSIGTPERGLEFVDKTGFPAELLLCDPDGTTFSALNFKKGVLQTFFSIETPLAIWKRIREGKAGDIKAVLGSWVKAQWEQGIWNPPKQDQALQQGGALIFHGRNVLLAHKDKATSAHIDLDLLLAEATKGL